MWCVIAQYGPYPGRLVRSDWPTEAAARTWAAHLIREHRVYHVSLFDCTIGVNNVA